MPTVFIVDDDVDLRFVLTQLLATLPGLRVDSAGSLRELEQRKPSVLATDFILLDINLGAGQPNGIDVYQFLKDARYEGKIIFFTGHTRSHPLIQAALGLPDVSFLEKPASIDKILEKLS